MAWYHHVLPEQLNGSFDEQQKVMDSKRLIHNFDSCICTIATCPDAYKLLKLTDENGKRYVGQNGVFMEEEYYNGRAELRMKSC